jgi:hypothetical protein
MVLAGFLASLAEAQIGDYLGPGIMSRGSDGVGARGGQTVDLRFFANVNAIYDTGLVPLSTDTTGKLVDPGALYGVEAQVGAYGTHNWRRAQLGLDYKGTYRDYSQNTYYNGSDQQLQLGYTYQKTRRLRVDFRGLAGTYAQGFGSVFAAVPLETTGTINPSTGLLFDNRSSFLEGGMDVTYVQSVRNSFTVGGEGYDVLRQSKALIGMHGYTLRGSFEHKLSMNSSVSVTYNHYHYDFPRAFGEATIDAFQLGYFTSFDRKRWSLKVQGGALQSEVEGLETVNLDPAIANILGVSTTVQTFYRKNILPNVSVSLSRKFKSSNLTFSYSTGTSPGNGVYLTSRQTAAGGSYSYTGIRKASLSLQAGYLSYASLGQSLTPYHSATGGASATYALARSFHLTARYEARYQEIDQSVFNQNSYRVSVGIAYSPGDIPLSIF